MLKPLASSLLVVALSIPALAQEWDITSLFNNYQDEGWIIFQAPRAGTSVTQNPDGTVTITRLQANSDTIYLHRDVSWKEPDDIAAEFTWSFTYEFRLKVDQIGGPAGGTDVDFDRASIYPLKNNPETGVADTFSNGRTWLCSFDEDEIGSRYFANPYLPKAEVDMTEFHVLTFVCSLDYILLEEKLLTQPTVNFGQSYEGDNWPDRALGDHSPWTLYIDRDFDNPVLVDMPGSGWNGWDAPLVDEDGVMQIGFQGTTKGQITLDYFRTGNGIILDPNEPAGGSTQMSDWFIYN